ncbi:MAG: hypothetical protein LUQ19_00905, partial [Methanoregula sp.]|nr:hypothetical protein [Methanoregula sp.]
VPGRLQYQSSRQQQEWLHHHGSLLLSPQNPLIQSGSLTGYPDKCRYFLKDNPIRGSTGLDADLKK